MEETIGFFDIFWSIFWLFLMLAWIWVVISVLADVFRSRDIGGMSKALWVLFIILIPWLGVMAYIIVRGDRMHENQRESVKQFEDAQRDYIRSMAGTSPATELEKLAALKAQGILTEEEFGTQKARILNA
ncbi:MAG: SHOCT domain-containing protein [Roseovarius sp.]